MLDVNAICALTNFKQWQRVKVVYKMC